MVLAMAQRLQASAADAEAVGEAELADAEVEGRGLEAQDLRRAAGAADSTAGVREDLADIAALGLGEGDEPALAGLGGWFCVCSAMALAGNAPGDKLLANTVIEDYRVELG